MVRCNVRMQFDRSVHRMIVDTQIYEDLVLNAPCSNCGEMLYGKSNNSDYIYADWHQPRYPRVIPEDTNDAMWVICSNSLSVKISLSGPRTRIASMRRKTSGRKFNTWCVYAANTGSTTIDFKHHADFGTQVQTISSEQKKYANVVTRVRNKGISTIQCTIVFSAFPVEAFAKYLGRMYIFPHW